jgi:hypothetical protein
MPQRALTPEQQLIWRAAFALGLMLALVGAGDAAGQWIPLRVGTPEWELGTVTYFFDTVPLLLIGLALLVGSGVALGRRWQVRTMAVLCILLAVLMWLAAVLFGTVVPLALRGMRDPVGLTMLKKSLVKTGVQVTLYPFALLWLAAASWRASRRTAA